MRVNVLVVVMLTIATTAEASGSCMSKTEARRHFSTSHLYWHGPDHCWDATSVRLHHQLARRLERKIASGDAQANRQHDADRQGTDRQDFDRQDFDRKDFDRQDFDQASDRQDTKLQDSNSQDPRSQDFRSQDLKPLSSRRLASRRLASSWQASMSEMLPDDEPAPAPLQPLPVERSWADRWVNIEPAQVSLAERLVDVDPVTPPPLSNSAPDPELRMMVAGLVFIVVTLMLAILQVLFRAARGPGEGDQAVA
jgi:hypothetical protein